jgi:uncharacterized protein YprB with RNaseH-like and TPR domain
MRSFGDREVFAVRRAARDLLPDVDLEGELKAALERLTGADPETIDPALRPAAGRRLEDLVVLDLETTGFWGCPIFLVGMLLEEEGELVTLQLLARDYPEEAAMLTATSAVLENRELLVTFNGKSYDVPCLRERAVVHRAPTAPDRLEHVDVLHPARRRWGATLPDCRLQTLERLVAGIHRTGDVPSAEIPAVYHGFTVTGDPSRLFPVLHHSRVDVVTTARVFAALADSLAE